MLLLIVMITSLCKQYKSVQTIHNAQITKGIFYTDKIVVCVFCVTTNQLFSVLSL